jgi:uracil-DNA glycosylase family 4
MPGLVELHAEMRRCRICADAGHAITPGAVFSGGAGGVMLIGQAPGVTEVEAKRPFNASSGRRLFQWLTAAGWDEGDFRRRHYMTAVTKCYPGKATGGRGDRVPSREEQALCRPFLEREMGAVKPRVVILVGGLAIKLMFPRRMKLRELIGRAVYLPRELMAEPVRFSLDGGEWLADAAPARERAGRGDGRFIIPLPHPSGASLWPNKPENKLLIDQAIAILSALREAWRL